jgi:hypothetical protein
MGDLIAPSPVIIEQRDLTETIFDEDTREPISQVSRGVEFEIDAQVSWSKTQSADFKFGGQGGQSTGSRGYLVFSVKELRHRGITLSKGDRVKSIAGIETDVYLKAQFYAGHMTRKPKHEYWDFENKEPSKV